MRRRRLLVTVFAALIGLPLVLWLSLPLAIRSLGGAWDGVPGSFATEGSPEAQGLVAAALNGLDLQRYTDYHVHALGLGAGGSGCFVNEEKLSWRHPWGHLQFEIYRSAAGIDELATADEDYVDRLLELVRAAGLGAGTHQLLAFDKHYLADGQVDLGHTEFYVPNDYVLDLTARYPDVFAPTASVHPYRADALDELDRLAARGVRWIKWLPSAMGIDPAAERCDAFYERMAAHDMVLLTHGGEEQAVDAAELQRLGNPLLLRRALDSGLRVVVAHCASLGTNVDLDDPAAGRVASFDLFLRLMDDPRYEGRVFGEISAVTQVNRMDVLARLLEREDLHERLVHGSDYPLPAVNAVIWTSALAREGFLDEAERDALNEVYDANPLLFDLVVKRTLRHPQTRARFAASVFTANPLLE